VPVIVTTVFPPIETAALLGLNTIGVPDPELFTITFKDTQLLPAEHTFRVDDPTEIPETVKIFPFKLAW
jgi:hypothetical protein